MVFPDSHISETEKYAILVFRYVQDKDPGVIFPALGKNWSMDFLAIDLGNYAKSGLNVTLDQDVSIHDMLGFFQKAVKTFSGICSWCLPSGLIVRSSVFTLQLFQETLSRTLF